MADDLRADPLSAQGTGTISTILLRTQRLAFQAKG
jgi:hypothetical protein